MSPGNKMIDVDGHCEFTGHRRRRGAGGSIYTVTCQLQNDETHTSCCSVCVCVFSHTRSTNILDSGCHKFRDNRWCFMLLHGCVQDKCLTAAIQTIVTRLRIILEMGRVYWRPVPFADSRPRCIFMRN
ncbi:hypothetical protein NP493_291g00001 [Ridgeia piscesae]|uniref:Uncharacterized protein n=1 Tax=Ridgeia piscesae TaxID=27915 RepID=A0AAD9NWW0_RIDPI|nr:hypothetical protein NP493_291g00001 [Ridgeia piscesae]